MVQLRRVKVIFINVVILTLLSMLMRTIGVAFQVYISNRVGPEGVGLFQLIISIYVLALTISTSGIRLAATRIISEELAKGNDYNARRAVKVCLISIFSFSIVVSVLLFFMADYIGNTWLSDGRTILSIRLLALSVPFVAVSSVFSGYFTAVRRALKAGSVQVVEQLIRIGFTMLLLILVAPKSLEYACATIVLGSCLAEVVSCLIMYITYRYDAQKLKTGRDASTIIPRMLNIALPIMASASVTSGIRTLQQILVPLGLRKSGASADSALATYGIVSGMVMPVLMFPSAILNTISDLIVPELTECQTQGSKNRLNYIVTRVFNLGMLCSVFIMFIFFRFSDELGLAIYNSTEAGYYIRILSPLIPIMYMDNIVDGMLKGLGQQVSAMSYNIIESLLSVTLIYLLLPRFAIAGYIFTIFTGRALNFGLSLFRLLKIATIGKGLSTLFKGMFAIFNAVILSNILFFWFQGTDFPLFDTFYAQIPVVTLFYYILLRMLSCITDEDILWFRSLFN